MEITNKESLVAFLTELDNKISMLNEKVDTLAPVESEEKEETEPEAVEDTPTDEEVDEIDSLLND